MGRSRDFASGLVFCAAAVRTADHNLSSARLRALHVGTGYWPRLLALFVGTGYWHCLSALPIGSGEDQSRIAESFLCFVHQCVFVGFGISDIGHAET